MPVRQRIHRRFYPLRAANMAACGLVVMAKLIEQPHGMALWGFALASSLAWPHIAYYHASTSRNGLRAEHANCLIDAFIIGCWIALLRFGILPCACIVATYAANRLSAGLGARWLSSLASGMAGVLGMSLWVGADPQWNSALPVQISLLPLVLLHSLFISWSSRKTLHLLVKQNAQLRTLGRVDPLTRVYSREYWWQKARAALRQYRLTREPTSLLVIDIDHFKRINDAYGHTVGDEVLQAIGLAIRNCLRSCDLAGRYGGDEFAVLCHRTKVEDAYFIALRIRDQLAQIRLREHPALRISASIGVAAASSRFQSLKEWIQAADSALYTAKGAGRDQVVPAREAHAEPPASARR